MGKRHKPEEIIGELREPQIVLAQGGTMRTRADGSPLPSRRIIVGARNIAA